MQWNFGDIVGYIKSYISPQNTSTAFSAADNLLLKNLVNLYCEEASINYPINELRVPDYFIRTYDDYSTGTLTVVAGSADVTLAGGTATFKMIGRKIRINGENTYYTIINIDGAVISLNRTYLGTSGAGITYQIFDNTYDLPSDCVWVKKVYVLSTTYLPLKEKDWDFIEVMDPQLVNTSDDPEIYCLPGNKTRFEPFDGTTYTAGVSTTTSVLCTSLLANDTIADVDYYKDWNLINVTRGLSSKVSAYNPTTQTLTLVEAIDGQTTGDLFYLTANRKQISLYRRLTSQKDILVKYYKTSNKLVNDYDVPLIDEDFREWITCKVLVVWFSANDTMAAKYQAIASAEDLRLKNKYGRKTDSSVREGVRKKTGRMMTLRIQ